MIQIINDPDGHHTNALKAPVNLAGKHDEWSHFTLFNEAYFSMIREKESLFYVHL